MEIRYILPGDSRTAVSRVYEKSWKYAYQGIIPQEYLDSIPEGRWTANLDRPGRHTLLCVDGGEIVGTSSFCRSRWEQYDGWGEVVSIYFLPDYMGKGFGKLLMERTVSELRKLGYKNIFLWVLAENTRARAFYERFGFRRTDDLRTDVIGGRNLREIRYALPGRVFESVNK